MSAIAQLSDVKRNLFSRYLRGGIKTEPLGGTIPPRDRQNVAPLSYSQEQIWFQSQRVQSMELFNESVTIHYVGPLNVSALTRSINEIVRRHEAWRTSFSVIEGRPVQNIHSNVEISVPVIDLQHLPEKEREPEALRIVETEAKTRFDLTRVPLFKVIVAHFGNQAYSLFLIAHQIILDGVSLFDIFLRELSALYDSFSNGSSNPLFELPTQYADFAQWQRKRLRGEIFDNQLAYWQRELEGPIPVLNWPNNFIRPEVETFRGTIHPFEMDVNISNALKVLSKSEGVTLFVTVVAGFIALLHAYTQQNDIIIGTVAPAGRKHAQTQALLGYFLNPVAIRAKLSANHSFQALIQQMRTKCSGALSNEDVPFQYVVERLNLKCDPSRNPIFQVAISQEPPLADVKAEWDLTPMDVQTGGARWDLYLVLDDRPTKLLGRVQYNPDIFTPAAIRRLLKDYQLLLETVGADPRSRLSDLTKLIR